jgi:hypothetical protein
MNFKYKNFTTSVFALAVLAMTASTATAVPTTFDDLGVIGGPGTYIFNTDNSVRTSPTSSNTDTELGIWDMAGTLLAQDDDGSALNLWSEISIALTPGMYYVGISEFSSDFEDNFVNAGIGFEPGELATLVLNIDGSFAGSAVGSDQLDQETAFFKVTVSSDSSVPTPATLALLGLGLAGIGYQRRKQTPAT